MDAEGRGNTTGAGQRKWKLPDLGIDGVRIGVTGSLCPPPAAAAAAALGDILTRRHSRRSASLGLGIRGTAQRWRLSCIHSSLELAIVARHDHCIALRCSSRLGR